MPPTGNKTCSPARSLPRLAAFGLGLLCAWPAAAQPGCLPPAMGEGAVVRIVDATTLELSDGTLVPLAGLLAADGEGAAAIAERGRRMLVRLVLGRRVTLHAPAAPSRSGAAAPLRDRLGRMSAHVSVYHDGSSLWLQREMVRLGLAQVLSFKDNRACAAELLEAEARAREARRGLWALDAHAVLSARAVGALSAAAQSYRIVEGRVVSVRRTRRSTYLNFGAVWRDSLTGVVAARDRVLFERAGVDLEALAGRTLRLRGWLERRTGPTMALTHPEQLEIVGP